MSMSQAFLSAGVSRRSWNEIAGLNTCRFQEFIARLNPCGNEPSSNAILIRLLFFQAARCYPYWKYSMEFSSNVAITSP